ncbi:FAD-binding oxidoreductase [Effusibacillus consociatus]|uniref:FAD-binding oxidoreductase n=1 Tax=Effusibacillus consociatus TaxID=1117041 RepID=A0ABV9Q8T5_9BACL
MKDFLQTRAELQDLIGGEFVSECPEELLNKLGVPDADLLLVKPGSEQEVSAVLKYANMHGLSVIPIGNGQQLHIGAMPRHADILLSSQRLAGIVEHSAGDLTMTVRAGTPFSEVQEFLKLSGQFVPVTPPTLSGSTIGGLVATAANGPERVLYGSWRDIVIGLRVVYPNGEVIRSGGKVVKNVAGYDMNKLFVGSQGTLAFITEVTLKLRPYPKHRELILAASARPGELIELAERILASECVPSALELIRTTEGGTVSYHLAVGSDEVESAAKYQADRILEMAEQVSRGIVFTTLVNDEVEQFWLEYRSKWGQTDPEVLSVRAGFPIPRMTVLLDLYEKEASSRGVEIQYSASLGTATLRIQLKDNEMEAPQAATRLHQTTSVLRELAEANGGYLVIEHASPNLKQDLGVWGTVRGGLSLMKGIKQTVDPNGILSPGRFVGGI